MPATLEVRSFLPIDLPLIHRLTPYGLSFDSATALTRGIHTLEGAVWGAVPVGDLGTPTFVIREGENGYVAQYRHKTGERHAHIVVIAPNLEQCHNDLAWLRLLEAMLISAGRRGALTLNAEIEETNDAFVILRQAGFATYARQEIWAREPAPVPTGAPNLLRPGTELDAIGLKSLYLNVVPHIVRQADPPPDPKHGMVYERKGQIIGYFTAQEGKYGIYVQAILRPDVSDGQAQDVLVAALANLPRADKLPVYFRVRRYQEWLQGSLDWLDFEPRVSQAVMVRHTTRRIEHCAYNPVHVPEGARLIGPPILESYSRFGERV